MSDCLFCKIANKEFRAVAIYENDAALGILDIHPIAPGHTVILPKVHAETILDLPDSEIQGVFKAVKETILKIKESLAPDGFTIGWNHGKNAGQAIDHLHIHIVPRYTGDGGGSIHSVVNNPPKKSLEEIKAKILRNN